MKDLSINPFRDLIPPDALKLILCLLPNKTLLYVDKYLFRTVMDNMLKIKGNHEKVMYFTWFPLNNMVVEADFTKCEINPGLSILIKLSDLSLCISFSQTPLNLTTLTQLTRLDCSFFKGEFNLGNLPNLKILNCTGCLQSSNLVSLSCLTNLIRLDLKKLNNGNFIGELDLNSLICLTNIITLDLSYNYNRLTDKKGITDRDMIFLSKNLIRVQELNLQGTGITGFCIKYFSNLQNLTDLNIGDTPKFCDEHFQYISALTNIKKLGLVAEKRVTYNWLAHITKLTKLEEIDCRCNFFIDNSVLMDIIENFKNLKKLYVFNTNVTGEFINHINTSLTNLTIRA